MAIVWHLSAIQFSQKTVVSGVLLSHHKFRARQTDSWFSNARQVIGSYFKNTCRNKEILVTNKRHTLKTTTNKNGSFSVTFNFKVEGEIFIHFTDKTSVLSTLQSYPILFKDPPSGLNVISDIDETIMVSYTNTLVKRFFTTLFKTSEKRGVISFTKDLFDSLKDQNPRFFYVSKSENNLFKIISNFIQFNNLPKGPLLLTPFLNFSQLVGSKKNRDFKLNTIETLIENSKNEQFILVGDDSQRDMEIYTVIAKKYKMLISNVYIRQTKKTISDKQKTDWKALQETGVKTYYFKRNEVYSS
ncbi:phosphatase domain-containing protein [Lutibacter holmesii]|uniref:Phosphatase domain-containing protein n=1 Tax=Lutibacter holmesii TaxID=1137985 RepID=A0ABW3WLX7_9FLAO